MHADGPLLIVVAEISCATCGYDGYGRAFEQQSDESWRCEACPPAAEGATGAD